MDLNKEQRAAVLTYSKIALVLASAGTGKTSVIIERIKTLFLRDKCNPSQIALLTFSRKAASELKERIKLINYHELERVYVGTYHALAYKILRDYEDEFKRVFRFNKLPEIVSEPESRSFAYKVISPYIDQFMGLPVETIYQLIKQRESLDKDTHLLLCKSNQFPVLIEVAEKLDREKACSSIMDFDDILKYATELIVKSQRVAGDISSKYQHLLIDEFQDTSHDNYNFLKLFFNTCSSFFSVGDDWQSIYKFRSAEIKYILNYKKYFKKAVVYKLKTNYRSYQEIVNISNKFIKRNQYRTKKRVISKRGKGGEVLSYSVTTKLQVYQKVITLLEKKYKGNKGIAILVRTNLELISIANYFKKYDKEFLLEGVELLTIHRSKGLEFESVIIAGLSNKKINRAIDELEEERRVLYVALTRAIKSLSVIYLSNKKGGKCKFAEELAF